MSLAVAVQTPRRHELGMVGLGVMGRNFPLNLADHGHRNSGDLIVDADNSHEST